MLLVSGPSTLSCDRNCVSKCIGEFLGLSDCLLLTCALDCARACWFVGLLVRWLAGCLSDWDVCELISLLAFFTVLDLLLCLFVCLFLCFFCLVSLFASFARGRSLCKHLLPCGSFWNNSFGEAAASILGEAAEASTISPAMTHRHRPSRLASGRRSARGVVQSARVCHPGHDFTSFWVFKGKPKEHHLLVCEGTISSWGGCSRSREGHVGVSLSILTCGC